ncbi:hypothetical protein L3Q82_016927 [Scortum barcoo]|uniref:Uncharacterized protein n=1 Tax=Scortum barcoo TaxID=214431 RepID=A0ACB8X9R9_9TELE|nr:hypothetical protein L3Q82_016927 [Scortum barcoo]
MDKRRTRTVHVTPWDLALPGPHPGARPGVGAHAGERLVAGSLVFAHGTRPGSARNGGDVGPPSSRLTTRRKVHEGPVQCGCVAVVAGSLRGAGPSTTLELPRVSGGGWCGLAYSSPAQPPCVGVYPGEREGRFPCAFGLGIGLLLLFVHTGRTAVQSTPAFLESLGGVLDSAPTGTPLFYWGTSTLTWATTVIPGGA